MQDSDLRKIYHETRSIYDANAAEFDKNRARDGRETEWLEKFIETIPAGGHILDLGCGTGEPIAAWMIARGFRVTGVDYSESMLEIARERYPGAAWVLNDMRNLTVSGPFNGIISWHGSFHLTQDEQRTLIPRLAELLEAGGTLMLTTGAASGEATGSVAGNTVYHASLAPEEYRERLQVSGFSNIQQFLEHDVDGPFVLLARR